MRQRESRSDAGGRRDEWQGGRPLRGCGRIGRRGPRDRAGRRSRHDGRHGRGHGHVGLVGRGQRRERGGHRLLQQTLDIVRRGELQRVLPLLVLQGWISTVGELQKKWER